MSMQYDDYSETGTAAWGTLLWTSTSFPAGLHFHTVQANNLVELLANLLNLLSGCPSKLVLERLDALRLNVRQVLLKHFRTLSSYHVGYFESLIGLEEALRDSGTPRFEVEMQGHQVGTQGSAVRDSLSLSGHIQHQDSELQRSRPYAQYEDMRPDSSGPLRALELKTDA